MMNQSLGTAAYLLVPSRWMRACVMMMGFMYGDMIAIMYFQI